MRDVLASVNNNRLPVQLFSSVLGIINENFNKPSKKLTVKNKQVIQHFVELHLEENNKNIEYLKKYFIKFGNEPVSIQSTIVIYKKTPFEKLDVFPATVIDSHGNKKTVYISCFIFVAMKKFDPFFGYFVAIKPFERNQNIQVNSADPDFLNLLIALFENIISYYSESKNNDDGCCYCSSSSENVSELLERLKSSFSIQESISSCSSCSDIT